MNNKINPNKYPFPEDIHDDDKLEFIIGITGWMIKIIFENDYANYHPYVRKWLYLCLAGYSLPLWTILLIPPVLAFCYSRKSKIYEILCWQHAKRYSNIK